VDKKLPYPYKILKLKKKPNIVLKKFFNTKEDFYRYINEFGILFDFKKYTTMYCLKNVELAYNFLKKFWDTLKQLNLYHGGNFFSISSLSTFFFFKKCNIFCIKNQISIVFDNFVRTSYFGGRCEVFGNPYKDDFIHYFDFSGMYAQCMLQQFPIDSPTFIYDNFDFHIPGFYKISWFSDSNIPVLPMKSSMGKLMFYAGHGEGVYWNEEILLFLKENGKIKKTYCGLVFKKEEKVFSAFIEKINALKLNSNFNKKLAKILINSFYGRLGMFLKQTRSIVTTIDSLNNLTPLSFKILNETVFAEIYNEKLASVSNVIYAAIITSKARIKLFLAFKSIIAGGGRLLYCDTDSIVVAFKKSQINKKFGEINFDKNSELADAVFAQPKSYSLKYKNNTFITKVKGFKQNMLTFLEFKKIFYSKIDYLKIKQIFFLKNNFKVKKIKKFKSINFKEYNKRKFTANKKNSFPIHNYIHTE